MKKTGLILILLFAGAQIFAQNGTIRDLSGTVELKHPGSSTYAAAKIGDPVGQNTIISTGFKSSALIEVGSTMITVRPLTRLTLTEIRASSGTETINANLQAGRVRVDVNPPSGTKTAMAISSPMATASVRGTSFDFDTRNLKVNHGTVRFNGSQGKPMLVNVGASSQVNEDSKAADPIKTRGQNLLPKPPVGADTSGGSSATKSSSSSGVFTIELEYPSKEEYRG